MSQPKPRTRRTKRPPKQTYERGVPTGTLRARQVDLDVIDEVARRLKCRPRDALTLAVGLLRKEMGMERETAVDSVDGLARQYGDDAVIRAELELPTRAHLSVAGEPLDGYVGYAMCALDANSLEPLTPARIGMIDEATRDRFDLGEIEPAVSGATLEVKIGELLERWKPSTTLSAENIARVRADGQLREALREQLRKQREEE